MQTTRRAYRHQFDHFTWQFFWPSILLLWPQWSEGTIPVTVPFWSNNGEESATVIYYHYVVFSFGPVQIEWEQPSTKSWKEWLEDNG